MIIIITLRRFFSCPTLFQWKTSLVSFLYDKLCNQRDRKSSHVFLEVVCNITHPVSILLDL